MFDSVCQIKCCFLHIKLKALRDGNFKLFESSELKLARGDKVRGSATMHNEGIEASRQYRVADIRAKHIVLDNGHKQFKVSTKRGILPLEHDYVRSISQAAGCFDKVIVDAKAYSISSNLINELSAISQNIDIHTNDIEKASKTIKRSVERQHATDLILRTRKEPTLIDVSNYQQFKQTIIDTLASISKEQGRDVVDKALDDVIEHLSDREASFNFTSILQRLSALSMGEAGYEQMKDLIADRVKSSDLLIEPNARFGTDEYYTTPKALAYEKGIVSRLNGVIVKSGVWGIRQRSCYLIQ